MRSCVKRIGIGIAAAVALAAVVFWMLISSVTLPGEVVLADGSIRNVAQYVEMRDGVRLAVDVWLPENYEAGDRLPTAMRGTRYWMAQDIRIALAGHDGSVFDRYPADGNPTWTVFRQRSRASAVTIPMKVR
jgi:predicted acyl esterase